MSTATEKWAAMDEPTFDAHGYPTDETLKCIETWPYTNFDGLMKFVHRAWHMPEWGWVQKRNIYRISTGGWSGNESLIDALQGNMMFWSVCWWESKRGGHYRFEIPKWSNKASETPSTEPAV